MNKLGSFVLAGNNKQTIKRQLCIWEGALLQWVVRRYENEEDLILKVVEVQNVWFNKTAYLRSPYKEHLSYLS